MKRFKRTFLASDYYNSKHEYAQNWKTVDHTLYRLCSDHRSHNRLSSVTAKVAIIGRTYTTGIERKISTAGTQGSSITQVARCFFKHRKKMNRWFTRLGKLAEPLTSSNITEILSIHGLILQLLTKITINEQLARSFVSKYMHFHNPIVPIYDNVANEFMPKLVPLPGLPIRPTAQADPTYAAYVSRFATLYQNAASQVRVTVRSLDYYIILEAEKHKMTKK